MAGRGRRVRLEDQSIPELEVKMEAGQARIEGGVQGRSRSHEMGMDRRKMNFSLDYMRTGRVSLGQEADRGLVGLLCRPRGVSMRSESKESRSNCAGLNSYVVDIGSNFQFHNSVVVRQMWPPPVSRQTSITILTGSSPLPLIYFFANLLTISSTIAACCSCIMSSAPAFSLPLLH